MLESFSTSEKVEWIFVDNASKPEHRKFLEQNIKSYVKKIKLILNDYNFMFTAAVNQGMKASIGDYFLLLNPDCLFKNSTWLKYMIEDLERYSNAGICGNKQLHGDGTIHHGGGYITPWNSFEHFERGKPDNGQCDETKVIRWVTGSCFLIKKKVYKTIGGFNEKYRHYDSDNQYCTKARENGFNIIYSGRSEIIHYCGQSSKQ